MQTQVATSQATSSTDPMLQQLQQDKDNITRQLAQAQQTAQLHQAAQAQIITVQAQQHHQQHAAQWQATEWQYQTQLTGQMQQVQQLQADNNLLQQQSQQLQQQLFIATDKALQAPDSKMPDTQHHNFHQCSICSATDSALSRCNSCGDKICGDLKCKGLDNCCTTCIAHLPRHSATSKSSTTNLSDLDSVINDTDHDNIITAMLQEDETNYQQYEQLQHQAAEQDYQQQSNTAAEMNCDSHTLTPPFTPIKQNTNNGHDIDDSHRVIREPPPATLLQHPQYNEPTEEHYFSERVLGTHI